MPASCQAPFQEFGNIYSGHLKFHVAGEWRDVWLMLRFDAWYIPREKGDLCPPEGLDRWKKSKKLELARGGLVFLVREHDSTFKIEVCCPNLNRKKEGPKKYLFLTEDEESASWWRWMFENKVRSWAAICKLEGAELRVPSRPSTVIPFSAKALIRYTITDGVRDRSHRFGTLRKGCEWLDKFSAPAVRSMEAVKGISSSLAGNLWWVPFVGVSLGVVSLAVNISAHFVEARGYAHRCCDCIRTCGEILKKALERSIRRNDDKKFLKNLVNCMQQFEGCARDFDSYVLGSRLCKFKKRVVGGGPSKIFKRLENLSHSLNVLLISKCEDRVDELDIKVANQYHRYPSLKVALSLSMAGVFLGESAVVGGPTLY